MLQRGGRIMLVVALLLKLYRAEGSPSCEAQPNADGTFSFSVKGQKDCADYSWKVNGTTVAYEGNFNRTLVQISSHDHITFKSCQPGVAYFCDRENITCDNLCSAQSGRRSGDSTTPPHTDKVGRNQGNNISISGGVLGAIITTIIILIAVIAFVSWKKCKKCKNGAIGRTVLFRHNHTRQLEADGANVRVLKASRSKGHPKEETIVQPAVTDAARFDCSLQSGTQS